MHKMQLKFLKILCSLYDGEHYVPESKIREKWPDCPSHNAILHFGKDVYYICHHDFLTHAYMPTPEGITLVRERGRSNLLLGLAVATLVVAALTLAATFVVSALQPFFQ